MISPFALVFQSFRSSENENVLQGFQLLDVLVHTRNSLFRVEDTRYLTNCYQWVGSFSIGKHGILCWGKYLIQPKMWVFQQCSTAIQYMLVIFQSKNGVYYIHSGTPSGGMKRCMSVDREPRTEPTFIRIDRIQQDVIFSTLIWRIDLPRRLHHVFLFIANVRSGATVWAIRIDVF